MPYFTNNQINQYLIVKQKSILNIKKLNKINPYKTTIDCRI